MSASNRHFVTSTTATRIRGLQDVPQQDYDLVPLCVVVFLGNPIVEFGRRFCTLGSIYSAAVEAFKAGMRERSMLGMGATLGNNLDLMINVHVRCRHPTTGALSYARIISRELIECDGVATLLSSSTFAQDLVTSVAGSMDASRALWSSMYHNPAGTTKPVIKTGPSEGWIARPSTDDKGFLPWQSANGDLRTIDHVIKHIVS